MAKTQKSEDFSILCSSYVTVTSSDRRANAENTLSMSKSHALVCEEFVMRKTPHRLRKAYSRNLYKVGPGIELVFQLELDMVIGVFESFVKYASCISPR